MITDLPTKHIKRHHSDKHFSEFLPTRWRQKSTGKDMEPKLYHRHPMYRPTCCFSSAARYKRLNPEYSRGIRNVPLPAQQPTARQILSRSPSGASRQLTLNVTRSTQPCIPPGSLNRVPASAGIRAGMSPRPGGR